VWNLIRGSFKQHKNNKCNSRTSNEKINFKNLTTDIEGFWEVREMIPSDICGLLISPDIP